MVPGRRTWTRARHRLDGEPSWRRDLTSPRHTHTDRVRLADVVLPFRIHWPDLVCALVLVVSRSSFGEARCHYGGNERDRWRREIRAHQPAVEVCAEERQP